MFWCLSFSEYYKVKLGYNVLGGEALSVCPPNFSWTQTWNQVQSRGQKIDFSHPSLLPDDGSRLKRPEHCNFIL